jgi:predicted nucleotidyltransferase
MVQFSWDDSPPAVKDSVIAFVEQMQLILKDSLRGVFLHGSLAMACFNPDRSDIDALVVVRDPLTAEDRHRLILFMIDHSGAPFPYEISILREANLFPWRYPTPFEFHYSEDHRIELEDVVFQGIWRDWHRETRTDPDLAAHITILHRFGITLYGDRIEYVFPPVPRADYLASIVQDAHLARDNMMFDPTYTVLNLCRVYYYLATATIASKDQAGEWALHKLGEEFHPVLQATLDHYRGHRDTLPFDPIDLARVVAYLDAKITDSLIRRDTL